MTNVEKKFVKEIVCSWGKNEFEVEDLDGFKRDERKCLVFCWMDVGSVGQLV